MRAVFGPRSFPDRRKSYRRSRTERIQSKYRDVLLPQRLGIQELQARGELLEAQSGREAASPKARGFFPTRRDSPGRHVPVKPRDRKSTRLNSSHGSISYAVFCLKKKRRNGNRTSERKEKRHQYTQNHITYRE